MSDAELFANLTFILDPGSDYENEEVDEVTRRFQADLSDQNEVVDVNRHTGVVQSGAKAVAVHALNAVDVTARPSLFAGLIDMVRNWVNGGEDRRVELAFPQADQSVIIKALPRDLPVVLKALAEYEQLRPKIRYALGATNEGESAKGVSSILSHSGGAELNADEVNIGGDVVGRDKIMSAGGHIIIAKEGATVIINDRSVVANAETSE
jgi:hypothetical protein